MVISSPVTTVYKPKFIGSVAVDSGVISVIDHTHIKVDETGSINLPSYNLYTEITPESTDTLPIHFGLVRGNTLGRKSHYNYYYRTGAKKNSGSPRGGCNFYCFLHLAKDRIALRNRRWCASSLFLYVNK